LLGKPNVRVRAVDLGAAFQFVSQFIPQCLRTSRHFVDNGRHYTFVLFQQ
jgi:hypothetical protein